MTRSVGVFVLASLGSFLACRGSEPAPAIARDAPGVEPGASTVIDGANVVAGVVEAPDGTPAADAVVALNGVEGNSFAILRTEANGHFRTARPKERFAVTVTSVRGTAAFVAPAAAAAMAPLRIRLQSPATAFTIAGTVTMPSGSLTAHAFVVAERSSPDEGDIFYASVAATGAFTFQVPPGRYWVRSNSDRLIARGARTNGAAGERREIAIAASERAPAPEAVVRWLSDRALPIETTEIDRPTDDIAALATVLAKARVIGIGEATHGTHEYFRLKHRLLERLVTHHGVTLLAMEANFSDAEQVDTWIRTGAGTVDDAMKGLFIVWRTEEVRDLLVWMRKWNADPRHKKKIGFRGYDVQGARSSMTALRAYFRKVDPTAENEVLGPLAPLDADTNARGMLELGETEATATREAAAQLLERLVSSRGVYVTRSSLAEHALAMQHARVLEQARARFAAKGFPEQFAARDRAMAENVVWLLGQIGKDERMMVWAHNGHIQIDASTLLAANMGTLLHERLGSDYLAAGFVLDEGSYRAWVKPGEPVIADVAVGPREPGWVSEAFARVGAPMFAVDLRGAPEGAVRDWLFAPHVLHSCGWLVSEAERKGSVDVLGRIFDVAIYVGSTTGARQLPRRNVDP